MDRIKGEGNEQQRDRAEKHHQNRLYLDRFEVQKVRLLIKNASWLYSKLCFLCRRGAHFHKNHENTSPKNEKCWQNHTRYMKISPQWGRMHQNVIRIVSDTSLKLSKEATCSSNTHICDVSLRCSLGGMEEIKGARNEFQSDGAENYY